MLPLRRHRLDLRWWTLPRRRSSSAQITSSRGGSCLTTLRKLVLGLARLISLGALSGQLRQRPFYVTPDAAQRDAEDALAATKQVDHLIVGGALEDRDPITHQGDLG